MRCVPVIWRLGSVLRVRMWWRHVDKLWRRNGLRSDILRLWWLWQPDAHMCFVLGPDLRRPDVRWRCHPGTIARAGTANRIRD